VRRKVAAFDEHRRDRMPTLGYDGFAGA